MVKFKCYKDGSNVDLEDNIEYGYEKAKESLLHVNPYVEYGIDLDGDLEDTDDEFDDGKWYFVTNNDGKFTINHSNLGDYSDLKMIFKSKGIRFQDFRACIGYIRKHFVGFNNAKI